MPKTCSPRPLTQPKKSGRRRLGSHLAIVAKHDLQKLAPAVLSYVESEVSALMITVAEKVSADSCGFTVRPEVNIPSPAIRIPQTQSHPNEDDLRNCSRYTESGVSDASVSAGRAEPIDEPYS